MDFTLGTAGAGHKVAVVMPVYNDEQYVAEAIESVLAQTYTDFHFYVLDNGSTDGGRYVLSRYLADPRVTIVRRNRNSHSQAFSDIVQLLDHELLACIFSDDVWEPNKLARSLEAIGDKAAVISNCAFIDEQGRTMSCVPPTQFYGDLTAFSVGELLYRILFYGNPIHPVALLVRMEVYKRIGGYLPFMNRIGDMQFFAKLLLHEECAFVAERLQKIRVLPKQSSTFSASDIPAAKRKGVALFYEQFFNLQSFVTPTGLARLHLIVDEIKETDSDPVKLWMFGQSLIRTGVGSYLLFGVNCLMNAAAMDRRAIQALVERSQAMDLSHYFETLFSTVGKGVLNVQVATFDDAARVAALTARVSELEQYVQSLPRWMRWLRKTGIARRRRKS